MNEKMKKSLQKALRAGETIRWEGGTQPFGVTAGREGRRTLLRWILSTVCIGAVIVLFAANGGLTARALVILLALWAVLVGSPVLAYRQVLSQYYIITDERAILLRGDGSVYSLEWANMGACRLYPLDFGGAALALGSVLLEEKDKQLRWRASHPHEGADANGVTAVRGLVFYHIERAEEAMRLLSAAAKEA